MKKYLFILVSSSFLVTFDGAKAAENHDVVRVAQTMTAKPHWAVFEATADYNAVKGNMGLTHPAAIKEALEKAYDAWLPGHLAANPALAGAGFKAAVAAAGRTGAKKTAAAVMADPATVGKLARHHKRDLITAMATHDAADTAAAIVAHADAAGNHPLREALAEHHKAPLIAAMATHDAAATAAEVVANPALRAEVITALQNGHHALSKPTFVDILHRIRDAIVAPANVDIQNAVRDAARDGLADGLGAGDDHFADEADIRGANIV
jgi:hypothetical protein